MVWIVERYHKFPSARSAFFGIWRWDFSIFYWNRESDSIAEYCCVIWGVSLMASQFLLAWKYVASQKAGEAWYKRIILCIALRFPLRLLRHCSNHYWVWKTSWSMLMIKLVSIPYQSTILLGSSFMFRGPMQIYKALFKNFTEPVELQDLCCSIIWRNLIWLSIETIPWCVRCLLCIKDPYRFSGHLFNSWLSHSIFKILE